MKIKLFNKIVAVILTFVMLFSFVACGSDASDLNDNHNFDNNTQQTDNVGNLTLGEDDGDENETIQKETIIGENITAENIKIEDITFEDIKNEQLKFEHMISEAVFDELLQMQEIRSGNVELVSVQVKMFGVNDDVEEYHLGCENVSAFENDYEAVLEKFQDGMKMLAVELLFDVGGVVVGLVTANPVAVTDSLVEMGVKVGTTAVGALAGAAKGLILSSIVNPDEKEQIIFDTLESAVDGMHVAIVTVNAVLTVKSAIDLTKSIVNGVQALIKKASKAVKNIDVVIDGASIGKYIDDDVIQMSDGAKIKIPDDGNIYHNEKFIGRIDADSLDVNSGKLTIVKPELKAGTYNTRQGSLKYTIDTDGNYYNSNGTKIGTVDSAGWLTGLDGKLRKQVAFADGVGDLANVSAATKAGLLVDETLSIANKTSKNGKELLDANGNVIAKIRKEGYLHSTTTGKVIGRIDDVGKFDGHWVSKLLTVRSSATKKYAQNVVDVITQNDNNLEFFPELTVSDGIYIKEFGKLPAGFEVHHIKSVSEYPELAGDMNNLELLSKETHFNIAHNGNYHTSTGKSVYGHESKVAGLMKNIG